MRVDESRSLTYENTFHILGVGCRVGYICTGERNGRVYTNPCGAVG